MITRTWPSSYQNTEQRAYAYAALTEDCERAVDEAGGAGLLQARTRPQEGAWQAQGMRRNRRSARRVTHTMPA